MLIEACASHIGSLQLFQCWRDSDGVGRGMKKSGLAAKKRVDNEYQGHCPLVLLKLCSTAQVF
jgi:hypothetical protein